MGKSKKKAKLGEYQYSADSRRIIPLNGGKHCYVHDTKGKLHHLKVGSEKFDVVIEDLKQDLTEAKFKMEMSRLSD